MEPAFKMEINQNQLKIPILLLIFNRPDLTKKVFDQIRQVRPLHLFIAADGPRPNHAEKELCTQARSIIDQVDWDCDVRTLFRESNLGCRQAVSEAIDWFFDNVEQGIVLEDDCLPLISFFGFCEALLNFYKNDSRIMMISGNNFQNGQKRGDGSYYFTRYCHIWGWATWKRAWKCYDAEMKTFPQFKSTKQIENVFSDSNEQNYWLKRFERAHRGEVDTWDYQWVYSVFANYGLSIMPNSNLVENIGFDSRATHHIEGDKHKDKMLSSEMKELIHPSFVIPQRDAEIYTMNEIYKKDKKKKYVNKLIGKIKRKA